MKINVTRQHIMDGKQGDSDGCPLALAINDATGRKCHIFLNTGSFENFEPIALPRSATNFRSSFDGRLFYWTRWFMRPFSFEIHTEHENPPNEIVSPVDKAPDSLQRETNEEHNPKSVHPLISNLITKITREPKYSREAAK